MGQVQSNVTSIIPHIQSFNVSDFTSGSIPTKNIGKNDNVNNAVSITDKLTDKLLRKHFTHLEDYSLKASFDSLCVLDKSTNISYIDEKTFTDYLNIPVEIGAGPLIYRSFINLGNYPSSSSSSSSLSSNARDSDMHLLTYNSLVKAVAIYCNKFRDVIDEDRLKLIFYSFSIPYDHKNGSKNHNDSGRSNDFSEPSSPQISTTKDNDNFRSLFDQDDDDNSLKLRSQDLVKILTALVWIMSFEMSLTTTTEQGTSTFVTKPEGLLECSKNLTSSQNVHQIRDAIISIADNASRYNDRSSSDRSSGSDQGSTESSSGIVWSTFKQFVERNMPNVFDGFTRFFYNQFLIGQTLSQKRKDSLFLGPQTTYWPTLDRKSNILDQVNMAILSWMLPNKATRKRVWNRLYVGNLHGFSMSSFSNHVFNYPGPTLMLIRAEIIDKRTSFSTALTMKKTETNIKNNNNDNSSQRQTLLLGAYVAETWRSTSSLKACFGSDEFFLFEIWPTLEVFPTTKKNTKYAYYNPSFGIGFGGLPIAGQTSSRIGSQNASSFVLQLDNTLQHGKYRNDMLNELSPTYSLSKSRGYFDISFEVLELEVFGLEGGAALDKQKKELEWEVKEANKRKGFRRHSSKNTDLEILKLSGIIDDKSRKEIIRREASL